MQRPPNRRYSIALLVGFSFAVACASAQTPKAPAAKDETSVKVAALEKEIKSLQAELVLLRNNLQAAVAVINQHGAAIDRSAGAHVAQRVVTGSDGRMSAGR